MYRRLVAAGHACAVVAPALIPRKSGERVKTDRRDALNLARIERRSERASAAVRALSWKAQKRLCGRFHRLTARGKRPTMVVAAIARELTGFIWAVVRETQRPGEAPVTA